MKRVRYHLNNLQNLLRLSLSNYKAASLIRQVREDNLTFLEISALVDLHDRVTQVKEQQLNGILLEAGCALGGSALVMAAAKEDERPLFLYDAFEMIPPPSSQDDQDAHARYEVIASGQATGIKGESYYGYQENLEEQVKNTFKQYGFQAKKQKIHFIRGYYETTLHVNEPVALAHIDCDWHDSVMTCLERIVPHLVPGGILIIDGYEDWSGCRKAVDTYFSGKSKDDFIFEKRSRLHIVRS